MTFRNSVFHPCLHHSIAISDRPENRLYRKPGAVAGKSLQAQEIQYNMTPLGQIQVFERPDKPFGRIYFMHHTTENVLSSHGIGMRKMIRTAIDRLVPVDMHGHVAWVHPLRQQSRIREGPEDEIAGRI